MDMPMKYLTEANSAEAVQSRNGPNAHPRTAAVLGSLVTHLHAFIKEVELTEEEWGIAIDFLTRTGKTCTDARQEFVLLSDTLGVSMLVDGMNHRRPPGATDNTVFGPFHVVNAPKREMGDNICLDGKGESCLFRGQVRALDGAPIAGATVDVWCDNAEGFYDVQQPGIQPPMNNRGVFTTGEDGAYVFRGAKPVSYPIPYDGPVGEMLTKLDRHPWRPAHMHFLITAPGFDRLTTHVFVNGDQHLDSDAVFGVKDSLVADFVRNANGVDTMWTCEFDFILAPE